MFHRRHVVILRVGNIHSLLNFIYFNMINNNHVSGWSLYSAQWAVLTVDDCFDLGRVAYSEADYYHTELWMVQALRQLDEGETSVKVDKVNILDYLSFSVYQQGALKRALDYTKRLLQLGQCLPAEKRQEKVFTLCSTAAKPNYSF